MLDQCLSINEDANSTHIAGSALRIKASNRMTMPISLAGFTEQGSTVCSVLDMAQVNKVPLVLYLHLILLIPNGTHVLRYFLSFSYHRSDKSILKNDQFILTPNLTMSSIIAEKDVAGV